MSCKDRTARLDRFLAAFQQEHGENIARLALDHTLQVLITGQEPTPEQKQSDVDAMLAGTYVRPKFRIDRDDDCNTAPLNEGTGDDAAHERSTLVESRQG